VATGIEHSPVLWNNQFTHHTRAVVFTNDLLLIIGPESIRETENFANVEIWKICNGVSKNQKKILRRKDEGHDNDKKENQRTKRSVSIHAE